MSSESSLSRDLAGANATSASPRFDPPRTHR
jgi:hypothetical protein